MIYIGGLVVFLLALIRVARALNGHKALLLERGASARSYNSLKLSLWLFPIPPIVQLIPVRLMGSPSHPIPLALMLFVPGILLARHVRSSLPPGGYDYQVAATDNVIEVLWVAAGGIGLVLASVVMTLWWSSSKLS